MTNRIFRILVIFMLKVSCDFGFLCSSPSVPHGLVLTIKDRQVMMNLIL